MSSATGTIKKGEQVSIKVTKVFVNLCTFNITIKVVGHTDILWTLIIYRIDKIHCVKRKSFIWVAVIKQVTSFKSLIWFLDFFGN